MENIPVNHLSCNNIFEGKIEDIVEYFSNNVIHEFCKSFKIDEHTISMVQKTKNEIRFRLSEPYTVLLVFKIHISDVCSEGLQYSGRFLNRTEFSNFMYNFISNFNHPRLLFK